MRRLTPAVFALFVIITGDFYLAGPAWACQAEAAVCAKDEAREQEKALYRCSMHPEVTSDKPARCPTCNMHLEQVTKSGHEPEKDGHQEEHIHNLKS